MRSVTKILAVSLVVMAFAAPKPAYANTASLYFAQTGALLAYCNAHMRILYAALTAREFDASLTKNVVKEIERSLTAAKRSTDRAADLLPEKKMKLQPKLQKLRDQIKAAEAQLQKLATDIEEQTAAKATASDADTDELEDAAEPSSADWELLKTGSGWLGVDVKAAQSTYSGLARKMGKSTKYPPKPRGKRKTD